MGLLSAAAKALTGNGGSLVKDVAGNDRVALTR